MKEISDSDRWNPAHFGEMPRKLDSYENPLVFWDESIEPPEPDDYDTLIEYEDAWEKWGRENSECLTYAAQLEMVSPSPDALLHELITITVMGNSLMLKIHARPRNVVGNKFYTPVFVYNPSGSFFYRSGRGGRGGRGGRVESS